MDLSELTTELKRLLDNSVGLNNLLGTKVNDSKVFIRNTVPQNVQFPILLISDLVHAPLPSGTRPQHYTAAIDVTICVGLNSDGSDDLSMLHRVYEYVETVVESSFSGTAESCGYNSFRLQQAAATQALDTYSVKIITYQGKVFKA